MKKEITTEALLRQAEIHCEIENLMARHCYYHAAGHNNQELDEFWVQKDEGVCWTQGMGRRDSLTKMRRAYGDNSARNCMANYEYLCKVYPQAKGRDPYALMEMAVHTLTTPMIEVAGDLDSAKGYWLTPGTISSNLNCSGKKEGFWIWERYAGDFVQENGRWKFIRLSVLADFMSPLDESDWSDPESVSFPDPETPPELTPPYNLIPYEIKGEFHRSYSRTQLPQDTPPIPEPFQTMDETFRY